MNFALFVSLVALFAASPADTPVKAPGSESKSAVEANDPAAEDYQKLLEMDEAALQRIEKIFEEARALEKQGIKPVQSVFLAKIDQVIEPVQEAYEKFIENYPDHVKGRLAYASFLGEIGEEASAITHLEKARTLAPDNPASWNNLANIYGHIGPVRKAFHYYAKAMELDPTEPVYVQNLATTTYLFRKDAMEMYRISEEEVFNKALDLYRQAMKLDPDNFLLATDYAMSFYGIRPMRVEAALSAWENALKLAKNDLEKEGIYIHLARVKLKDGRLEEAEKHLAKVEHPELQDLRNRLERNIEKERNGEIDEEALGNAKADGEPVSLPGDADRTTEDPNTRRQSLSP